MAKVYVQPETRRVCVLSEGAILAASYPEIDNDVKVEDFKPGFDDGEFEVTFD